MTPKNKWEGPDRREAEDEKWHLDKKVPISLIVALLGYGVTGIWAFADVKKEVEVIKANISQQPDRDRRQDEQVSAALTLVRSQLERMENKMDRVLENRVRN